ncbi:hypothetical protein EGW08_018308 [Elysia chlorotica]|uniref:Chitin-binding type-2 domain-containing protein n=1 Tax=Elysia chlorotica TaxID=188477 RepID=A0A3S1B7I1_ELYCH|nr:hypothetical protein EGW08_018308 [Elysia chlorotica]
MSTGCDVSGSYSPSQDHRKVDSEEYDVISQTSGEERRKRWVRFFERESYRRYYLLWKSRQFSELLYYVRHGFLKSRHEESFEPAPPPLPAIHASIQAGKNLATPTPGIGSDVIGASQSASSSLEFQVSMASGYCQASPSASGDSSLLRTGIERGVADKNGTSSTHKQCRILFVWEGKTWNFKGSRASKARRTAELVLVGLVAILVSAITAMTVLHMHLTRDVDSSHAQSQMDLPGIPYVDVFASDNHPSTSTIPVFTFSSSGPGTTSPSRMRATDNVNFNGIYVTSSYFFNFTNSNHYNTNNYNNNNGSNHNLANNNNDTNHNHSINNNYSNNNTLAGFFGGGSPDGAGGLAYGGLDFGFGGNSAGLDGGGGGGAGSGNSRGGSGTGDAVVDFEELLRDMPPKEVLTDPIATKVALTPPPLTTRPPSFTHKPPEGFFGGGSPDGAGGLAYGGLDFGFGGNSAGLDGGGGGGAGSGNSRGGVGTGDAVVDFEELLRDMPPKEVLPDPIATKVALTPPPLTTRPPSFTHKPPEATSARSFHQYLAPELDTEKIEMLTKDVVAEIGMSPSNNLKISCTARKAWGWTYMSLSRYEGDSQFSLEFLGGVEKRDEWPFIPIDSRMSDFSLHRDESQVTLTLETKYAMCEDKGRYLCEIVVNRTFHSKTFNVDVRKKPDPPVLSFPEDAFEGDVIWIVTTWDAGNPLIGHIVHDVVKGFRGEYETFSGFSERLPFSAADEQTISWKKDCTIMVENKYSVRPSLAWNGTEIIARIVANENATDFQGRVIERVRSHRRTLTVLNKSVCLDKTGLRVEHPYTCNKYITCYSNGPRVNACPHLMCFDVKLQICRYMNL